MNGLSCIHELCVLMKLVLITRGLLEIMSCSLGEEFYKCRVVHFIWVT